LRSAGLPRRPESSQINPQIPDRIRTNSGGQVKTHRITRTRDAQAFAERLRGVFEGFELRGLSQRQMVAELNALGIRAPKRGTWQLKQVQRARRLLTHLSNAVTHPRAS
jgi:hypothetical protein